MLYQFYEAQRSISEPFADFAKAASKLFSNPAWMFSETPIAQRVAAGYDLLYRLGKDYVKPTFDIETVPVNGVDVAIHERVEMDLPFCELRRFKRFSDSSATLDAMLQQPVVLIVAPLSGHYATLLRETVRTMLSGHKIYITDWKNARNVSLEEGEFHLDDYVNYVQTFIRYLQKTYGNCHVMSVCQPTVPVLAAISLMASRGETTPLSMTMMGGPIDARKAPTSVNNLATDRSFEWFENNLIYRVPHGYAGEGRLVYPGFLQYTGFVAMNPDRHANSYYDYFQNLIKGDEGATDYHRKFYDEYNAVLDMDANYYLETIETVFQKFKLVNGTWEVRNPNGKRELVKPADIKNTGLITVEGELDDISGSGQTKAAHTLCTSIRESDRTHLEVKGAGHYGIFSGSKWRNIVYPQVRDFILRFQPTPATKLTPATRTAVASKPVAKTAKATTVSPKKPVKAVKAPVAVKAAPAVKSAAPVAAKKATVRAASQPAASTAAKPSATKASVKAPTPATRSAKAAPVSKTVAATPVKTAPAKAPVATKAAVKPAVKAVEKTAPQTTAATPTQASSASSAAKQPATKAPVAPTPATTPAVVAATATAPTVAKPTTVAPVAATAPTQAASKPPSAAA